MASTTGVTELLDDWSHGNPDALNQLMPIVYAELRRVASRQLRAERTGHTLQPTALVHEAYVRLVGQRQVDWRNRTHFFGVAAQVMRRVLVDHARRRHASKRGGEVERLSIDPAADTVAADETPILDLDRALQRLKEMDEALARIAELRVFGGLTVEEMAQLLNVSPSTVKRQWRVARAWLARELLPESRL
jgi:RNA polymerase sigma factor (TIGR02999 family)